MYIKFVDNSEPLSKPSATGQARNQKFFKNPIKISKFKLN